MNILNRPTCLVLNRNWQAINIRTPQEAFAMMATNVATAINVDYPRNLDGSWDLDAEPNLIPVRWEEWIHLPIRDGIDEMVSTPKLSIRVPTVLIAVNYSKVPKKRPKLCAQTIRQRDNNRCQYTGRLLKPDEGSLDHVIPRSRGGKDEWENLVWSAKDVNQKKADRLPEEAGLRLLSKPRAPKEVPFSATLRNFAHKDWRFFIEH